MIIDYYIQRCLTDHLNQTNTYQELSEMNAGILNEDNFRFICAHFIDDSMATITNQARTFFIRECLGFTDKTTGITWKHRNITFPYFYMMPKIHKKPDWKTRPVVSRVTSYSPVPGTYGIRTLRPDHLTSGGTLGVGGE